MKENYFTVYLFAQKKFVRRYKIISIVLRSKIGATARNLRFIFRNDWIINTFEFIRPAHYIPSLTIGNDSQLRTISIQSPSFKLRLQLLLMRMSDYEIALFVARPRFAQGPQFERASLKTNSETEHNEFPTVTTLVAQRAHDKLRRSPAENSSRWLYFYRHCYRAV